MVLHNPIAANLFLSSPLFIMRRTSYGKRSFSVNTPQTPSESTQNASFSTFSVAEPCMSPTFARKKRPSANPHRNEPWQQPSIEFPRVYTEEGSSHVFLAPPTPQTPSNLDADANMESMVLDSGSRQWEGSEMLGEFDVFMNEYSKPNLYPHLSLIFITEDPREGRTISPLQ